MDQSTNQNQQQKQIEREKQINIVQQTQHLYQDLINLTGIATETQAVLEYFKDDPNHPFINISLNRMILQANQSNAFANSINEDSEQLGINNQLVLEKEVLKKYYEELIQHQQFDERINALLLDYEKCSLSRKPFMIQYPSLPTGQQQSILNQEVVQKLLMAMEHQTQVSANISKDPNAYKKPTVEEINQINIQRQQNAYRKLFENFTMIDFRQQLLSKCSKFKNPQETMQTLDEYLKQIDKHFNEIQNMEQYNKIHEQLKFDDDQQKEQFKYILKMLISYDLGTLDTYLCQTLEYLAEKQIPKRIIMNTKE